MRWRRGVLRSWRMSVMSESCVMCGSRTPDGGLRMNEVDEMVCRWVAPCARRAERRGVEAGASSSAGADEREVST